MKLIRLPALAFALGLGLSAATIVRAGTHTWTGGGANELWNNAANWSGGAPTAGEAAPVTLIFPTNVVTTNNIVGLIVDTLTFNSSGTVLHGSGGGTLTFRGAGGVNLQTISDFNLDNTIASTLPVTFSGSNYFSINGIFHSVTIQSVVSGAGSVTVDGGGELHFEGTQANTMTGKLSVMYGYAFLAKSAGINAVAGPVETKLGAAGAFVIIQNANQIPDGNAVTLGQSGVLRLYADETLGNLTLAGGLVQSFGGALVLSGNVAATASSSSIFAPLSLGGATRTFNVSGAASLAISGAISNGAAAAGVTKSGAGTLTLSGASTFSGAATVNAGKLILAHNSALGTTAGGLSIAGGSLELNGVSIGTESLTLNTALTAIGTNAWAGAVSVPTEVSLTIDAGAQLTLSGAVTGAGSLTMFGAGVLAFSGAQANSFAGGLAVFNGTVSLNKTGVDAIAGTLQLGPGTATVRLQQANQIADSVLVGMFSGCLLDLNNNSDTIGSLAGFGSVNLLTATLALGGNNSSTTFSGNIGGTGFTPLIKNGAGTFTLAGTNNCTGTSLVNAGTLAVTGQLDSHVSVAAGATLTGPGKVGNVIANSGDVRPGNAVGTLTTGSLNLTNGAGTVTFEINGTAPGTLHDQIAATGAVNLNNPSLALALNTFGAVSNQYVLIANDGVDPVNGTFNGLPEGTTLTSGSVSLKITYHGGTGNDVALIQTAAPVPPVLTNITKQPSGAMLINGAGLPNTLYYVDATTSVNPPNWVNVTTTVANGSGAISFTDNAAPNFSQRFYRLRMQ